MTASTDRLGEPHKSLGSSGSVCLLGRPEHGATLPQGLQSSSKKPCPRAPRGVTGALRRKYLNLLVFYTNWMVKESHQCTYLYIIARTWSWTPSTISAHPCTSMYISVHYLGRSVASGPCAAVQPESLSMCSDPAAASRRRSCSAECSLKRHGGETDDNLSRSPAVESDKCGVSQTAGVALTPTRVCCVPACHRHQYVWTGL